MLPGFDLEVLAGQVGALTLVLIIAAILFTESGVLIGFFLPGDTILFTAGFLVSASIIKFPLFLMVLILFTAAVLGVSFGYWFGRKTGPRIFNRPDSLLFKKENIVKAEEFYQKHGGKTIILARFIPIVRTLAPVIAGVAGMEYRKFLFYNIIGAVLWVGGIVGVGYVAGHWLESVGIEIDSIILPVIAVVVLLSFASPLIHALSTKSSIKNKAAAAKLYLRYKFGKKDIE